MLVMVDFGIERVLVSSCDMARALRSAWLDMIYNYDEHQERAVESFCEEMTDSPTEESLRTHTQSCRDYGYKWTPLAIKQTTILTEQEYETLNSVEKLRICNR